jgi:glycosyltransferase involved in cell wall biosynthesis
VLFLTLIGQSLVKRMELSLSVITPSHNAASSLKILYSTLKPCINNLHWIIIDACSCDGSSDFLKSLKVAHSNNVTIVSEPDSGIYDAINKGIIICNTKYYVVAGADDCFNLDTLRWLLNFLPHSKYDLVLFSVMYDNTVRHAYAPTRFRRSLGWSSVIASHSIATVVRKQLHFDYGFYSLKYPILADGLFLARIFGCDSTSYFISKKIAGRFSVGGVSTTRPFRTSLETLRIQLECKYPLVPQLLLYLIRLTLSTIRFQLYSLIVKVDTIARSTPSK